MQKFVKEMALLDTFQSYTASAGRKYRGLKRTVFSGATSLTGFSPFVPKHLLSSPPDLRTSDPNIAKEFYRGRYMLAGRIIESKGLSLFSIASEQLTNDKEWIRELHGFGWLRHFSSSADPIASGYAMALVKDWIENGGNQSKELAWDVQVASKRLIAWLQHSIIILSGRDHEFHQQFMRSLGSHVRFLKRYSSSAGEGLPQLISNIALSYASICFSGHSNTLQFATQRLGQELERQVLPDGSHLTRNPQVNMDVLAFLLPLKEAFVSAGSTPPEHLFPAIERLMQGLRFFRLGDGNLARFNGAGVTDSGLIATLQRYDENVSADPLNALVGGYERMHIGDTIVLVDAAPPPRGELSSLAHAGCLALEFSSGTDCVVVNSGKPFRNTPNAPAVWRSTAAHSTAVFYNTSSSKFENPGASNNLLDGQLFGAQLKAESSRSENEHGICITAHHMGYVREFGARHQRILTLDDGGNRLRGNDWFSGPDKGDLYYTTKDAVTIHFHLHPTVDAAHISEENAIILGTRTGNTWRFECQEVTPSIEESIFFASLTGAVKTKQIALHFKACKIPEINWSFTKD